VSVVAGRAEAAAELARNSDLVARACRDMAARFLGGGRLLAFGTGAAAADAEHVSVEFVHPVIVGKRALPALTLTGDSATLTGIAARAGAAEMFAHQIGLLGRPGDIALGMADSEQDQAVMGGLGRAHRAGLLTVSLVGGPGTGPAPPETVDHRIPVGGGDPLAAKEARVTAYHVLWELVHVFLDRPEVLRPGAATGTPA
jgi:D-sedoheptulose 7-phosphate isomerase